MTLLCFCDFNRIIHLFDYQMDVTDHIAWTLTFTVVNIDTKPCTGQHFCARGKYFTGVFFSRLLMNLRSNNTKNVLTITWKCLMGRRTSLRSSAGSVGVLFQILSSPLEVKCSLGLFQMHRYKGKVSRLLTLQVSLVGCLFTMSTFSNRYW